MSRNSPRIWLTTSVVALGVALAAGCSGGGKEPAIGRVQSAVTVAPGPNFDTAPFQAFTCSSDPVNDENPNAVDLVGSAQYPAAYFAHDASYVYFRYRVNGDATGPGGFAQYAWVALMQSASGNPFQYQYELSLNGVGNRDDSFGNKKPDDIEIWKNDPATA